MDEFKFSRYEIEGLDLIGWYFIECCTTLEEAKKLKQHFENLNADNAYRIVEIQKRTVG